MTVAIKTDAPAVATPFGFIPPISLGCLGWWEFGAGTEGQRLKNLVNPTLSPLKVGTPTPGTGYETFTDNTALLRSQVIETDSMTIFAAFRAPALSSGGAAKVIHNWQNASGGLYINRTRAAIQAGFNGGGTIFSVANANYADWVLAMLKIESGVGITITDLTANVTSFTANAIARAKTTADSIRIGGRYTGTGAETVDVSLTAMYSRVLTDDEIATTAAHMRARLSALYSIVI